MWQVFRVSFSSQKYVADISMSIYGFTATAHIATATHSLTNKMSNFLPIVMLIRLLPFKAYQHFWAYPFGVHVEFLLPICELFISLYGLSAEKATFKKTLQKSVKE